MKPEVQARVIKVCKHLIATRQTTRQAAEVFEVSHQTIFLDASRRIKEIDEKLADEVSVVLLNNSEDRHQRAGLAASANRRRKEMSNES